MTSCCLTFPRRNRCSRRPRRSRRRQCGGDNWSRRPSTIRPCRFLCRRLDRSGSRTAPSPPVRSRWPRDVRYVPVHRRNKCIRRRRRSSWPTFASRAAQRETHIPARPRSTRRCRPLKSGPRTLFWKHHLRRRPLQSIPLHSGCTHSQPRSSRTVCIPDLDTASFPSTDRCPTTRSARTTSCCRPCRQRNRRSRTRRRSCSPFRRSDTATSPSTRFARTRRPARGPGRTSTRRGTSRGASAMRAAWRSPWSESWRNALHSLMRENQRRWSLLLSRCRRCG